MGGPVRGLWILAALWLGLAPVAAGARWLRADTAAFSVYSEGSEASLRDMATKLQAFDALLRVVTNTKAPASPTRLPVYVVASSDTIRMVVPGAGGAVGIYLTQIGGMAALSGAEEAGWTATSTATLFHEYAHHFMYQYASGAYPRWYSEGFAELVSTARIKDGYAEIGRFEPGRIYPLLDQAWAPTEEVLRGEGRHMSVSMFYAQAWAMVHFLSNDPARSQALGRYLRAVAGGADPVTAFDPAIGMTPAEFRAACRRYVRSDAMTYLRLPWTPPAAAVTVAALPASAERLLLLELRAALGTEEKEGARLLKAVRAEAAKWPGDRYARTVLAEAEIGYGDRDAGLALADALIAEDPTDAQPFYLRGLALIDAAGARPDPAASDADLKLARTALARANALRADDFRILAAYAKASPRPLADPALDVLLRARELAPQVEDIGLMAGEALAERGRVAEALAVLAPIAADPHGGAAATAAAELRSRIASPTAPPSP